ncbi:MAG: WYL domain-containing protein [Roseburia sp.]|nr:WYL domain-containing protein [Roseburia sp.]
MAKSYHQKLKILYIAQMLLEKSDEEHLLTTKDLISGLLEYGILAERKSIYSDIEALTEYGMDIVKEEGRMGGYYIASRQFELPELKLLVDSVQASKFITGKKSRELIAKLETLTSHANAGKLHRQVVVNNRNKALNESIYYNVDAIYTAMNDNVQIRFQYFSWTPDKKMELRKNGEFYQVSPWFLTWEDENYYLIAYDEEADVMKHYRVDKMLKPGNTDKKRQGRKLAENVDLAAYAKKTFGMFAGDEETVILECREELTGVCIDRFGTDVPMRRTETDHIRIRAEVAVSPQFYGWLAGLGDRIKIISPERVRDAYRQWIENIMKSLV